MKAIAFVAGVAAGVGISAALLSSCYPDMSRRMMRDGRRIFRTGKHLFG